MERERLEKFKEYYDNQKGQPYPCSNQTVLCGVITYDRDKALSVMQSKGAVIIQNAKYHIKWKLNDEVWTWLDWNSNYRGRRFYKIIIDKDIDEIFFPMIAAYCANYCCSVEII